jgi:hypothetical protein
MEGNQYLVLNKQEWLLDTNHGHLFDWTEEQIDNADEKGLIGTKHGVGCYLSRPIPAIQITPSKG